MEMYREAQDLDLALSIFEPVSYRMGRSPEPASENSKDTPNDNEGFSKELSDAISEAIKDDDSTPDLSLDIQEV